MSVNEVYRTKWAQPRRGERFPKHEAMIELWRALPPIADFVPTDGVFDCDRTRALLEKGFSKGEKLCFLFLLAVWNPAHYASGFALTDAISDMDDVSRAVVADWTLNPWWP